jgi:hypothetical protein
MNGRGGICRNEGAARFVYLNRAAPHCARASRRALKQMDQSSTSPSGS